MEELQKLMDDIGEFSDKTFGEGQRNLAILHHLKEEVDEAIEAVGRVLTPDKKEANAIKVYDEYADMMILLLDSARSLGIDANMFLNLTRAKIEVNKKRKWGEPDKNGVIRHIK